MRGRSILRAAGVVAMVAAMVPFVAFAGPAQRTAAVAEVAPAFDDVSFDLDAALAQRALLHRELMADLVSEGLEQPIRVSVAAEEMARLNKDGEPALPVRVGVVKPVGRTISLAPLAHGRLSKAARRLDVGAARLTAGGYAYTAEIRSEGATALRVHFTDFWLPASSELFLMSRDGQVFGPYTGAGPDGSGDFWSHTVMGESVVLQLRQRGRAADLEDTWFNVADVAHIGREFVVGTAAAIDKSFCSYNAPCIQNAECPGTSSAVAAARDAVAHMQWISGPYIYICSGGLLNDSIGSGTPYFLSANHCISRSKDANNLESFFQLTTSCGTTNCDDIFDHMANHPQSLRTLGASILSTNRTGDYTLFRLDQAAPAGSAFMGWTTANVANANNTNLYRISHPQGAPQAYSEQRVDTSAGTCTSWPRGSWIYSRDTVGGTEGGSSGSPVLNGAGQVVGQLSGACGFNVNDSCDNTSNATVDGALASYYSAVSQWLSPSGCNPSPENCTNGSDDDCDGAADCADSDCSADPACSGGSCGSSGASCSTGADCCSGNCRRGSCKGN